MRNGSIRRDTTADTKTDYAIHEAQEWFAEHVSLDSKPYTLDADQARAAIDEHKNALVTARAGSGKTRVIVAKVAYLVAKCQVPLEQITVFMFNRTAAAEVNQRIQAVKVDDQPLVDAIQEVKIASTFHKHALDIVTQFGERPQIIGESERDVSIKQALDNVLGELNQHPNPSEKRELLQIAQGFTARAGQKYPGTNGMTRLSEYIESYLSTHNDAKLKLYHQISYEVYRQYLSRLQYPLTDFNLLMTRATEVLNHSKASDFPRVTNLQYIMIDEYQDFSYLFFALTLAVRRLTPSAKLFAVGDDWQAINRFAGSDVDYFLNFRQYFPEDYINIPLATNYRSTSRIVERANRYMLTHYDSKAIPARAFNL